MSHRLFDSGTNFPSREGDQCIPAVDMLKIGLVQRTEPTAARLALDSEYTAPRCQNNQSFAPPRSVLARRLRTESVQTPDARDQFLFGDSSVPQICLP